MKLQRNMVQKFKSKYKNTYCCNKTLTMDLLVVSLILFVSTTLAQDNSKSGSSLSHPFSNNTSNESSNEDYKAAGMGFPTWEDIRESFKKFQAQLNSFRRNSAPHNLTGNLGPTQPSFLSQFNTNNFRQGGNGGHIFGTSAPNIIIPPPPSGDLDDYPPGYFRRPGNFFNNKPPQLGGSTGASDLQQHTTTTIYIICICLIVMVVGSILFVCVNKCQESSTGSTSRGHSSTSRRNHSGSAATINSSTSVNSNSRVSASTVSIAILPSIDGASGSGSARGSSSSVNRSNVDLSQKITYDLPPSYDSLFPHGKP